jgi:hypothetical protein
MAGATVRDADTATFTFLVGFASAERDNETLPNLFDVVALQPDQFRPTKAASKAEQQQRPVALVPDGIAEAVDHQKQVIA